MVAAMSKDGFLSKGDDPNPAHWTSLEDKRHYRSLVESFTLQVMGRTTYDSYDFPTKSNILKVVLTTNPEKYKKDQILGELEFHTATPAEFVNKYESDYAEALVLGGANVYQQFIDQEIVDEIYITIEPVFHGSGVSLYGEAHDLDELLQDFRLVHSKKLNNNGTILNRYKKIQP